LNPVGEKALTKEEKGVECNARKGRQSGRRKKKRTLDIRRERGKIQPRAARRFRSGKQTDDKRRGRSSGRMRVAKRS
jgi:hypothetical protein